MSSELMLSSRTPRNSLKVRWRVWCVRWGRVVPKRSVKRAPSGVGRPVDRFSNMPRWDRRVWMFAKAVEREVRGSAEMAESSRFAHSMTMRIPSISPSTLAKNRVSSTERVFRLSLRPSSSATMSGADVMLANRTLSPKSQTATPVS